MDVLAYNDPSALRISPYNFLSVDRTSLVLASSSSDTSQKSPAFSVKQPFKTLTDTFMTFFVFFESESDQVQYTVKIIPMYRFKAVIWFCNQSKVDNTDTVHRLTRSSQYMELTGLQVDKVDRLTMSIYGVNRSTGLSTG